MYKKTYQIENLKIGFAVSDNFAVLPKNDNGFVVYNCINKTKKDFLLPFALQDTIILNNRLFLVTDNRYRSGIIYEIDDKNDINIFRDISNYTVTDKMGDYLDIEIIENKGGEIDEIRFHPALYNWRTDKVIWQKKYGINFISSHIIARTNNLEYSRLTIETGEILWTFSFEGFGKVINEYRKEADVAILFFLGVVENQLWILLNSRQYLLIDVETGKQLALIGDAYDGKQYTNRQFGLGQIDDKNKKVILLSNHQYAEIDCKSFEIKDVNLQEEFEKHSVSSGGRFQIDADYIYFYDKKFIGVNQCCKVAVLDRKTLKVVWSYDFAQHGTAPMQMEKTDTHLFILDSGGTLHIFEREEWN